VLSAEFPNICFVGVEVWGCMGMYEDDTRDMFMLLKHKKPCLGAGCLHFAQCGKTGPIDR
jgi:hypothetical protein